MLKPTDTYSQFWQYLSQTQKDLILEGEYLMKCLIDGKNTDKFKDYSFLVFPFAKAYEGFLKQIFKDIKFISHLDYISDHLRLGKLMSPNLVDRLGDRSLYKKIKERYTKELADNIWTTWKIGRNQIFHYFPHNLKAINFSDAEKTINQIIITMEETFKQLNLQLNLKTQMLNLKSTTQI